MLIVGVSGCMCILVRLVLVVVKGFISVMFMFVLMRVCVSW